MVSERINNIFSLKDNIEHEKDNVIEGNVETWIICLATILL